MVIHLVRIRDEWSYARELPLDVWIFGVCQPAVELEMATAAELETWYGSYTCTVSICIHVLYAVLSHSVLYGMVFHSPTCVLNEYAPRYSGR